MAIWLLILLGLALAAYYMLDDPDPARPPIIVSSGSVMIQSSAGWNAEGGNRFKEQSQGKSVKSFLATTGTCTAAGTKLTVTFGTSTITLEPKRRWPWQKRDALVELPTNVVVDSTTPTLLKIATTQNPTSVASDSGTSCAVVNGRIEIQQVH
jgi:hypothetical protein